MQLESDGEIIPDSNEDSEDDAATRGNTLRNTDGKCGHTYKLINSLSVLYINSRSSWCELYSDISVYCGAIWNGMQYIHHPTI